MKSRIRPRRSILYMPASRSSALEKARTLAADALIFDLEDAVSPDAKETARRQAIDACASGAYGQRELIVRANGLDTPWGYADVAAIAQSGADAVLIPKVESDVVIRQVCDILDRSGAPDEMRIWVMLETPLGLLRAESIAATGGRLETLVMGTSDLAKDLHAAHTRDRLPFLTGLGLCLLAARAYGLTALDGVHLDLGDAEGFEYSCRHGLELGFDGKTLIHPSQIEACNRIFAPSAEEVAWSRRIIEAHAAAEAAGTGVVLVDGRLIENLHVENARRIVALAEAIAKAA